MVLLASMVVSVWLTVVLYSFAEVAGQRGCRPDQHGPRKFQKQ